MRPQKKKKKWLGKLLGFGLLGLLILGLAGVFVAREWLNRYLGTEEFRNLLATRIGKAAHAECRALFGDETQNYQVALQAHYAAAVPVDWQQR